MTQKSINLGTADKGNGDPLRVAFGKVNDNFTELYTALGLIDNSLNLGAFEFTGSVMTTTDSTPVVIDQATTVTSNLSVGGDIVPQTANGGDLGSSTLPWRSLYVSNNTIYIGGTAVGLDANGALTTGGTVVGSTPAWANITGKPTFATVATTGAYADLTGKPTIPTLGNISNGTGPTTDPNSLVSSASAAFINFASDLDGAFGLGTNDGSLVKITTDGGASSFEFTADNGAGSIKFPDLSTQTTAYNPNSIRSEGDINIEINLTDSTTRIWRFGEDGSLTLPIGVSIDNNVDPLYPRIIADSGKAFSVQGQGNSGSAALAWSVDPNSAGQYAAVGVTKEGGDNLAKVVLQAQSNSGDGATVKLWKFDETGALTIPGDIRSEGNINIEINLSDSTLRRWQFGEDGILTLPSVGKISNGAYDWTFGSTGITTFPGVINAGNINNLVVNEVGGGTSLTAGSQVQIGNSAGIAGAGVLIKNAVTNTLGGETSLEQGSKIQMDNGIVSLSGYDYNSLGGGEGLEFQMVVEVENNYPNKVVRIGTRIINTGVEPPTNVFQGVTISQYGELTFPDDTVQTTAWTGIANALRSETGIYIDVNLADSTLRRWQFGEDGNLTLPQGGNISEGGGISGAIRLTPSGGANEYQALLIYPTAGEGDHIHLTAGGGTTELYLGDDLHYVKLESDGNIRIQADNGVNGAAWTFGTDGSLTFPDGTKQSSAPAITIAADDSTQRTIFLSEESIKFIGAGGITTASDEEGNITITGSGGGSSIPTVVTTGAVGEGGAAHAKVQFTVTSATTVTAVGVTAIGVTDSTKGTITLSGSPATGAFDIVAVTNTYPGEFYIFIPFATNASGTGYGAPISGEGTNPCLVRGTMITMADMSRVAVENITYHDNILVWDFDLGDFASAKPVWIKKTQTTVVSCLLTFSDHSELRIVGDSPKAHRIFNKEAGKFTYGSMPETPIGTTTFNDQGEEITLISKEWIVGEVEFYNVMTDYHMNLFANSILTSMRYNNLYPITDMKFVKDSRTLRTADDYPNVEERLYKGFRLAEQTQSVEEIETHIQWLLTLEVERETECV